MPKTISRSATRRIAAIKAMTLTCISHTRRDDYQAVACDPAWAWQILDQHRSRLIVDDNGVYTIHTGGGEWYTLTEVTP